MVNENNKNFQLPYIVKPDLISMYIIIGIIFSPWLIIPFVNSTTAFCGKMIPFVIIEVVLVVGIYLLFKTYIRLDHNSLTYKSLFNIKKLNYSDVQKIKIIWYCHLVRKDVVRDMIIYHFRNDIKNPFRFNLAQFRRNDIFILAKVLIDKIKMNEIDNNLKLFSNGIVPNDSDDGDKIDTKDEINLIK